MSELETALETSCVKLVSKKSFVDELLTEVVQPAETEYDSSELPF